MIDASTLIKITMRGYAPPYRLRVTGLRNRPNQGIAEYQAKLGQKIEQAMAEKGMASLVPGSIIIDYWQFVCIPVGISLENLAKIKNGELLPKQTPDMDNSIKTMMDGIKKKYMFDDDQTNDILGRRRYGKWCRLELELSRRVFCQIQAQEFCVGTTEES